MLIRTDQPFMHHRKQITEKIAGFWDQTSEAWRTIWGPHIHHGYYENNVSMTPLQAQENLILQLAALLHLQPQDNLLDVGCGVGGSSLYLAKNYEVRVTGITLSSKQMELASLQRDMEGIGQVSFKLDDALTMTSIKDNSFDIVWSLESCEQFFDKSLFFQQAKRVLKPGGKFLLATWCSDAEEYQDKLAKDYQKLCRAFDLPYMPTLSHYTKLFSAHQFSLQNVMDWTPYVRKSWDTGVSLLNAYSLIQLLKMGGLRGLLFAKQVKLMQKAFHQNRIHYGVFCATKA